MRLVDAHAAAILAGRSPATIRWWAWRGWLQRRGTGKYGRALYNADDIEQLVERLATEVDKDHDQHQQ